MIVNISNGLCLRRLNNKGVVLISHSKHTKRGFSLYISKWNPSAKKYIRTCSLCGREGYNPSILESGFCGTKEKFFSEKQAIYKELTKILKPLYLDELDRCDTCAKIQDKE